MVKSEIIRILKHNLYLYFLDDLDKNVNNYINFFNLDVRDSLIHTIINNTIENIQFEENVKNKIEKFSITENEEELYFMLLDESYESLLKKARKTILQSLKAKQLQQELEYKNSKEYKQAQLKAELKQTLKEIRKNLEKLQKSGLFGGAVVGAGMFGILSGLADKKSKRRGFLK